MKRFLLLLLFPLSLSTSAPPIKHYRIMFTLLYGESLLVYKNRWGIYELPECEIESSVGICLQDIADTLPYHVRSRLTLNGCFLAQEEKLGNRYIERKYIVGYFESLPIVDDERCEWWPLTEAIYLQFSRADLNGVVELYRDKYLK